MLETTIELAIGQVWRSSKTWWRLIAFHGIASGGLLIDGPHGSVRMSRDGGKTWSDSPSTVMTVPGFLAWIRKTGAVLYSAQDHQP